MMILGHNYIYIFIYGNILYQYTKSNIITIYNNLVSNSSDGKVCVAIMKFKRCITILNHKNTTHYYAKDIL